LRSNLHGLRLDVVGVLIGVIVIAGRQPAAAQSCAAQPTFNVQSIPVGQAPDAIAIADVNGDGELDLVVANRRMPAMLLVVMMLACGRGGSAPP
jgi:uncharacterized 2Fe-2S/4Fe-4S cluster protein (DUF4445 family)